MFEIMERRIRERIAEEKVRLAKDLIKETEFSYEHIAKLLNLPLSTVEEIVASMQKKKKKRA